MSGLNKNNISLLARIIGQAYHNGYSDTLKANALQLIHCIKQTKEII